MLTVLLVVVVLHQLVQPTFWETLTIALIVPHLNQNQHRKQL